MQSRPMQSRPIQRLPNLNQVAVYTTGTDVPGAVVLDVLTDISLQVSTTRDEHPVQTLSPQRPD
jgi:hypothetical protein